MPALMSSMLFSFGKSKKKTEAPGQSKPGFMGSIMESVHGARLDGGSIVLWKDIGGGTYPCRPVGPWISEGTTSGFFRLIFQNTTTVGRVEGDTMASTNEVSRVVALAICRSQDLTGMLSVYTPDREDARRFMEAVLGYQPVEYGFSVGCLEANMANFRRRPWEGDEGLPGPMCLFGEYIGDSDSLDLPENRELLADFGLGFHIGGRDAVTLSADLGGRTFGLVEADADGVAEVPAGEFRLLFEIFRLPFVKDKEFPVLMSSEAVTRDEAMLICADRLRSGGLGVYTPDREDARNLMSEANRGRRPTETVDVPELRGMSCFTCRDYDSLRPRAVYGRPRADVV